MVIGGDQAVAVVHLHPVAAAALVPPHCTDYAGIGGVDVVSAGCGEVKAPVELARRAGDRIPAKPVLLAQRQRFQRCKQRAGCGAAARLGRGHVEFPSLRLGSGTDNGTAAGQQDVRRGGDG